MNAELMIPVCGVRAMKSGVYWATDVYIFAHALIYKKRGAITRKWRDCEQCI